MIPSPSFSLNPQLDLVPPFFLSFSFSLSLFFFIFSHWLLCLPVQSVIFWDLNFARNLLFLSIWRWCKKWRNKKYREKLFSLLSISFFFPYFLSFFFLPFFIFLIFYFFFVWIWKKFFHSNNLFKRGKSFMCIFFSCFSRWKTNIQLCQVFTFFLIFPVLSLFFSLSPSPLFFSLSLFLSLTFFFFLFLFVQQSTIEFKLELFSYRCRRWKNLSFQVSEQNLNSIRKRTWTELSAPVVKGRKSQEKKSVVSGGENSNWMLVLKICSSYFFSQLMSSKQGGNDFRCNLFTRMSLSLLLFLFSLSSTRTELSLNADSSISLSFPSVFRTLSLFFFRTFCLCSILKFFSLTTSSSLSQNFSWIKSKRKRKEKFS